MAQKITLSANTFGDIYGPAFSNNTSTTIHIHASNSGLASTSRSLLNPSNSSPRYTRGYIPANVTLFLGRDPEVDELVLLLTRAIGNGKRAHICILGLGGMGKTELAVKVMNHPEIQRCYRLRNLLFIACVQALSASLLLDILFSALDINRETNNTLNAILHELRSSGPLILLLDNFETPLYADGAREQVEQILRDIDQIPHVTLFITMREKKIEPLDPEASQRLFTGIYPEAQCDPELAELLKALAHMPLAVTLMAKLGKTTECITVFFIVYSADRVKTYFISQVTG
ncbi:P-loop containing nucleoside triphosphate hydrolase protein [Mycena floridula]|nr:P-loop containing nucleoside triphosphate hydrolase protein [Mycena floridula]